jgi:hypothetical protein
VMDWGKPVGKTLKNCLCDYFWCVNCRKGSAKLLQLFFPGGLSGLSCTDEDMMQSVLLCGTKGAEGTSPIV